MWSQFGETLPLVLRRQRMRQLPLPLLLLFFSVPVVTLVIVQPSGGGVCGRRTAVSAWVTPSIMMIIGATKSPAAALAQPQPDNTNNTFVSLAYGREEYTNAIVASRDTNLSPAEAYDVIRAKIPSAADARWNRNNNNNNSIRVADVGAGAGLSTTILYQEKGYRDIRAIDWSRTAWEASVGAQQSPGGVQFYEMDDDTFFSSNDTNDNVLDVIVYNFAINPEKAVRVARSYLSANGLLLAPCNDRTNYWYKQSYVLFDHSGQPLWRSDAYLGAWSIQFQPDVTSHDCTGIWCGNFNGFFDQQKMRNNGQ